jgi:bis(5'-nucleosidyl)-tetraphosphatase
METFPMTDVTAAGVIIFRELPQMEFLLLKHPTRWDLPKGLQENGESLMGCALREMQEETGIPPEAVFPEPGFEFRTTYQAVYPDAAYQKTLVIYWVWLDDEYSMDIQLTEHEGYQWFAWNPPHHMDNPTIDPLLAKIAEFMQD